MKLIEESTSYNKCKRYILEFEGDDLMVMQPDRFTRMLISECGNSNSVADKLLALEHIARNIESERSKNRNSFNVLQQSIPAPASPPGSAK